MGVGTAIEQSWRSTSVVSSWMQWSWHTTLYILGSRHSLFCGGKSFSVEVERLCSLSALSFLIMWKMFTVLLQSIQILCFALWNLCLCPLQSSSIDAQGLEQFGPQLPGAKDDFFCLLGVGVEVGVTAAWNQQLDIFSIWCFAIVVDQLHKCAVASGNLMRYWSHELWCCPSMYKTGLRTHGRECGSAHFDLVGSGRRWGL